MLWNMMNLFGTGPWTTRLYFSVLVLSCSLSVGLLLGTGIAHLPLTSNKSELPLTSNGSNSVISTVPSWTSVPATKTSETLPQIKKDDSASWNGDSRN